MDLTSILVFGLACTYLTHIFLLQQKESHSGPWPIKDTFIYFEEDHYTQPAAFFDRIRRLFGVYTVSGTLWKVNKSRAEMWECPICLSFWMSLPVSGLYVLAFPTTSLWILPMIVLAIACISMVVNKNL